MSDYGWDDVTPGDGRFPMYLRWWPPGTCATCLFNFNQHLWVVLVSASYRHSFLETRDRTCFVVLETFVFCHAMLGVVCDPDSLRGFYYFEVWFELHEDLVVVSAERINSLEVTLSIFRSHIVDDASLRVVVGECVGFCKLVGCSFLTMQGLSGGINQSLAFLVPRVFLFQNFDLPHVPIDLICAALRAIG